MIHCGAVIAAGISQGKSTSLKKNCKVIIASFFQFIFGLICPIIYKVSFPTNVPPAHTYYLLDDGIHLSFETENIKFYVSIAVILEMSIENNYCFYSHNSCFA